MGEVLTIPVRTAGREIIDRMARAMAHAKGREWHRMSRARQDQIRGQARAALRAFRPTEQRCDSDIRIACASWTGSAESASPERLIADVQGYVDEVLS